MKISGENQDKSDPSARRLLRVAVAAPLPGPLDYLPPADRPLASLRPGMRLRVPFGRGERLGLLWEITDAATAPREGLKRVMEVLDETPLLGREELELLAWCADYYHHPLGETLFHALPEGLRKGAGMADTPAAVCWRLSDEGAALDTATLHRAPRMAAVVECLKAHPHALDSARLKTLCAAGAAVLRRLHTRGWIEPGPCVPPPSAVTAPLTLNTGQRQAVEAVSGALGGFAAFLLEGVTGSGKTEVYLHLVAEALRRGGQVLILVPEIGLTPQLQRRLVRRIDAPVALLHSGLAAGRRQRGWWEARAGRARVVLGTRSAVFTPLPDLALILVDEEHDLSFKQQRGLRYSGRDLAIRRAQARGVPVVLGSATPALESLHNARRGRYRRLRLPARAGGAQAPRLDLVDLRGARLQGGLSPTLIRHLREALEDGGQAMLFLNRRGYAPVLTCHDCGWVAGCPHCDARLTLHREAGGLCCHHCGYRHPPIQRCPACGGSDLRPLGQGTERLEEVVQRLFPGVAAARIDRDSTRRRGELERLLEQAREGRVPLLLGTQMLAKGHHFPHLTLVGVLDLDQGLYGADFRAPERMAQLLVQVAGRAGRGQRPGRVLIQTRHPDHPLLQTLIHSGYAAFAELALRERQAAGLPPFSAQALLRAEGPDQARPWAFLDAARAAAAPAPPGIELWGPAPAVMERKGGRFRAQLLVQAPGRGPLQVFLRRWAPGLRRLPGASRVRWALDVDPLETA